MTQVYHNPYAACDRFPLGALPAGASARLRLRVRGESTRAYARLWRGTGEEWIEMQPMPGGYQADIRAGRAPGLLWYFFCVDTPDGRAYAGKPEDGACAQYASQPPSFQITVYDPSFDTPDWMRESIMMQILPDRFCAGKGGPIPPHGRGAYLHKHWNEPPHLKTQGTDLESVDFFGGNLEGIREKLGYIRDLGVTALYLNPIFRARSNHKYDVGDYQQIDPSFGTRKDFERLVRDAQAKGVHLVLDGVFSHTGADSRYFNQYSTYDSLGAYQSDKSPYAPWYRFGASRDDYDSWWGIKTLPNVNEMNPGFLNFIIKDEYSVVARRLREGAHGWRLDVADELPMPFLRMLRERAKREGAENAVIGEVWEDASNKIAYGETRSYALGDTLDSAMNYPLRRAILSFLTGKTNAYALAELLRHQASTLPKPMLYSMMNLLGSHDKPRVINVLAGEEGLEPPREARRYTRMGEAAYARGKARFIKAWAFVCALPGMPCMYYGDEAGLTGMGDPFCRGTYPWGREDAALVEAVRAINEGRGKSRAMKTGETEYTVKSADALEVRRYIRGGADAFGKPAKAEDLRVLLQRD